MALTKSGLVEQVLLALLATLTVLASVFLIGQTLTSEAVRLPGITIDRLSAVMTQYLSNNRSYAVVRKSDGDVLSGGGRCSPCCKTASCHRCLT